MSHPRLRGGFNLLGWIVGTVIALTDFLSNLLGYILLVLMVPVTLWMFWPWIKRWRPFTLAPDYSGSNSEGNAAPAPTSTSATAPRETSQPGDENLKQHCRELADRLYRFLKERGHGEVEVDDPRDPEMLGRNEETIGLYRRRFEGEVMALYENLKQRGWWGEEILDPFGRNRLKNTTWYGDIQVIAQRLSTIGHRL